MTGGVGRFIGFFNADCFFFRRKLAEQPVLENFEPFHKNKANKENFFHSAEDNKPQINGQTETRKLGNKETTKSNRTKNPTSLLFA
jgi:hypothetical protein